MKKRVVSLLLALAVCLSLLPATASAAEAALPDWYFLFAIFKNVDTDGKDADGKAIHMKYTMTEKEIDLAREHSRAFEAYMNQLGVMRAHVEVVEIDAAVTELEPSALGSYLNAKQAAPLLEGRVDLDRYDHVTSIVSLNIGMDWWGMTSSEFENGTGHACVNYLNQDLPYWGKSNSFPVGVHVHEFLHFMERTSRKWGAVFGLHDIRTNHYTPNDDDCKECYTDIILNRAKGTAGTGVPTFAWQYPPHVLRTMTELTVPAGAASIGEWAFTNRTALARVTIPGNVTSIGDSAFYNCTSLKEAAASSGLASIGQWAFGECTELTRVSLPASVTSVGYAAFWHTGVKEVYFGGTEAQWKAIQMDEFNNALTNANIHYNHLMADVKTTDWFAQPVMWALENGITAGTGDGRFSPGDVCTQGQILTFLWRAKGSPEPDGAAGGGDYYAVPLRWAEEQGLVDSGLSAKDPCTRAGAVTYLWKLAGSPKAGAASFTDVHSGAAYAQAAGWAVEKGIAAGTGADTFDPNGSCTRGQIVTFLYRALAG